MRRNRQVKYQEDTDKSCNDPFLSLPISDRLQSRAPAANAASTGRAAATAHSPVQPAAACGAKCKGLRRRVVVVYRGGVSRSGSPTRTATRFGPRSHFV